MTAIPKTKSKREPVILPEPACVVLHQTIGGERGWFVRGYRSLVFMNAHLNHLKTGAPPPPHLPKDWDWRAGFSETGPFVTRKDAIDYAWPNWPD